MARARPTKLTNAALQRLAEPFWEKVRGAGIDEYFLERLLRALLRRWRDDRFARVKQGGLQGDSRAELARVFIDLDVGFDEPRRSDEAAEATRVVASWMRPRSAGIRHSGRRTLVPKRFGGVSLEVLLGGPGQGKSTVGRFLMLIHGAVLLLTSPIAGITTDTDVANMRALLGGIARENIPLPEVLQLPVWIELREMADALLQDDGCDAEPLRALTSWFAATELRERDDAAAFEAALAALPWVMIFDGLDEVPPERGRMLVRGCVASVRRSFAPDARHIIGTSRPQSYEQSVFGEGIVERTLLPLTAERATAYTERFADCLHGEEEGERERLLKRMKGALANPTTAALMQSPLLVTIMAALVLHHGEPTDRRWTLFEDYYKTLYRRETERGTYASKTLREHSQLIDAIHMHVGMSLQVRSESAEGVSALMPEDELRALLHTRLRPKFSEDESARIAADILRATEQRLVFLVQSRKGMYGFDLRSFQEFMAAWQVVSLREAQVDALLLRLAPLTPWRNVMLFAIGQQYAHNSALAEERSVGLCAKLDEEGDLTAKLARPGARLAVGVLGDAPYGSATVQRDALAKRALSVWNGLDYFERKTLVDVLERVAPQQLSATLRGDVLPTWSVDESEIESVSLNAELEAARALAGELVESQRADASVPLTLDEIVDFLDRAGAPLIRPFVFGRVPVSFHSRLRDALRETPDSARLQRALLFALDATPRSKRDSSLDFEPLGDTLEAWTLRFVAGYATSEEVGALALRLLASDSYEFFRTLYLLAGADASASQVSAIVDAVVANPATSTEFRIGAIHFLADRLSFGLSGLADPDTWLAAGLPAPPPMQHTPDTLDSPGARVASIEITNLRAFETTFRVDVPPPRGDGQWIVFLGENATGKTTLLRALALALAHPSDAAAVPSNLDGALRRTPSLHGIARVRTADGRELGATVTSADGGESVSSSPEKAQRPWVVAYGCRRGSATSGTDMDTAFVAFRDLDNLFDRPRGVVRASSWLKELQRRARNNGTRSKEVFEAARAALRQTLLGAEDVLVEDEVIVCFPGDRRVPLNLLSDGYLTTAGWVVDLMARWIKRSEGRRAIDKSFCAAMEGVCLLDEIDLHLHPRWQERVIDDVRKLFPKMTFIVTTHHPLTLRGARAGEVFVLAPDEERGVVTAVQRDIPPGTRVDELVTGAWFNRPSAIVDKETRDLLDRHQKLIVEGAKAGSPERKKIEAELRKRLGRYADTSLERLAATIVAKHLDTALPEPTAQQREEVMASVQKILQRRDARKK